MHYESISCIMELTYDKGGLYLGSLEGAQNLQLLNKLGISAILTASVGRTV